MCDDAQTFTLQPFYKQGMDIATEDWDALFDAVAERLRLSVQVPRTTAAHRAVVLECVEALQLLHASLRREPELAASAMQVEESRLPAPPATQNYARSATAETSVTRHRGSFFSGPMPAR